jgi:hypothetical protein
MMSEDRIDKALEAMKNESVAPEESAAARARTFEKLTAAPATLCSGIQADLRAYLQGELDASRRLLVEDHLTRCPACRHEMAALKGESKVMAMPERRAPGWTRHKAWAIAAGLALLGVYAGRDRIDSMLAPGGPRATVESVSGRLYRIPEGALAAGATLGEGETVRTGPSTRAMLRLADGTTVELNERTELFVHAAWSGATIRLQRGDVIVQAAKQRRGSLRVESRDSVASVKGTIFAVSSGMAGSLVSVVEGSVEVSQTGRRTVLTKGQHAATNPALQRAKVQDAVAWSQNAEKYLGLLGDLSTLEQQFAALPKPALRTQASLLQYLPSNVAVYGAAPNLTGTIGQALQLFDQRAAESPAFAEWWNSAGAQRLRTVVDQWQTVMPMLGDEIVFALASPVPGGKEQVPLILAQVQPERQDALKQALEKAAGGKPISGLYQIAGGLVTISDSPAHLQWALGQAGQGASSAFAAEIGRRYQRGAGWLLGVDVAAMTPAAERASVNSLGISGVKQVFFEQRTEQGAEENEATIVVDGAPAGPANWLAPAGTSGAAEYISGDAVLALSASTRQPRQIFDEFAAQMAKIQPKFQDSLKVLESSLGISVSNDVAGALGTDFALAVERPTVPVPGWVAVIEVTSPGSLDSTVLRLVTLYNNLAGAADASKKIQVTQETADGREWTTLKPPTLPIPITWTYDGGYLIASSDRALALAAIATKRGGFALTSSPAFQQQLPAAAGMRPSGFVWVNTKGALQGLSALVSNPTLQNLAANREPVLVVANIEPGQIRFASRTRLTSLILNALTASAAGRASAPAAR